MDRIVHDLELVYLDNVRANQIGGLTDGISPEVASDLGYSTPEETQRIIKATQRQAAIGASVARHPSVARRRSEPTRPTPPVIRGESEADVHPPHYYESHTKLTAKEQQLALGGIERLKQQLPNSKGN